MLSKLKPHWGTPIYFLFWGYRYPDQTFFRAFGILALTYNPSRVCLHSILISCLIYVICICLQNSGVKHILCCVFSSSFLDVAKLSRLSIFDTTTRKKTQKNINKTRSLPQTTGGKEKPNIVFILKS